MFSLLYNSTFAASFRHATWDDLDETFQWFGVEDATFIAACRKVEYAAYLMRRYTRDANATEPLNYTVVEQAQSDLAESVPVMFRVALDQVGEQARAGTLPAIAGDTVPANATTLALVYELLYRPAFRPRFRDGAVSAQLTDETRRALLRLAACLDSGSDSTNMDASLEEVHRLLSREYEAVGWKICW
jgi:hypothetical protein